MKNINRDIMKKKYVLMATFIVLLLIVATYSISRYQNSSYPISENPTDNIKSYNSKTNNFNFTYPGSYEIDDSSSGEITKVHLKKDQEWDPDHYNLEKGASIIISYNKNVSLTKGYVEEVNSGSFDSFKDGNIKEKKINNRDAYEATYAYNNQLKVPIITRIYLQINNDVLELILALGTKISKSEYEVYQKEFDSIINSVKFQE